MDIGTVIFAKTAGSGARAEIKLDAIQQGQPRFRLYLDGAPTETVESGTIVVKPREGLYGFGGSRHQAPILGLTAAERAALDAAMDAVKAEAGAAHAATSEGQRDSLRQQRRDLGAAVHAAFDVAEDDFALAHARQDATAWTNRIADQAAAETARIALADFDAAHPEVAAEAAAEREARRAANVAAAWNN